VKHRAGVVGLRVDEFELERRREALEQRKPFTECSRLQDEAVLVNEPEPAERLRESSTAPSHHIFLGLAFQRRDLFGQVATYDPRIRPFCTTSVLEKTTFGMLFIGAA
jgi:hypothetical protein